MTTSEDSNLGDSSNVPQRARLISVEPMFGLFLATQGAITSIRLQYVQKRVAESFNYTLPQLDKANCSMDEGTDDVGLRVQSETAIWIMWMSSLSTIIPIVTAPILVMSSDALGRKPLLILSSISHLLATLILVAVSAFNFPLQFMFVSKTILGICGDVAMPEAICLVYITESTTLESRAVRIAALELAGNIGWGIGKLLANIILQESHNFTFAFGFPAALGTVCLLYAACPGIIIETKKPKSWKTSSVQSEKDMRSRILSVCKSLRTVMKWRIGTLLLIETMHFLIEQGIFNIVIVIGLGKPFCWSPITVGIYEAFNFLLPASVVTLLVKPLLHCIDEHWLLHLGVLSFIGQVLTSALATTTFQLVYLANLIGCLRTIPMTMVRFLLTELASEDEPGHVFAVSSFFTSIATASSPLLLNGTFALTVTIGYSRIVFYICVALLVSSSILNGILQAIPKNTEDPEEIELLHRETTVYDSDHDRE